MKKILFYISAVLILITTSGLSYAADTQNSELTTRNPAIDLLNEIKGRKKDFTGQNLYLEVYKTVNEKPMGTATKDTADKLGVSTTEVEKIVKTGDVSSLISANKDQALERVNQDYLIIMQLYTNSLGTETLRNDLESQVSPSEIFADGDTSNSDFDLLYDLNIIEAILFNETTPSDFGAKHPALKINILSKEDKEAFEGIFNPQAAEGPVPAAEETVPGAPNTAVQAVTNPISCFEEDSALSDAMKKFNEENDGGQGGAETEGEEIPETVTSETMPSAEPDDWPTKYLCPDAKFFCVTIDFVMAEAQLGKYPKTANCIACHIQKINEALDKIIKKPTSPNKLTGGKMEMPKCKSALINIAPNMNIITLAVPPPQQANEDVFFKANIEEQWKKFNETYKPLWYQKTDEQKKAEDAQPTVPQIEEKAAKKALMDAPPNATLEDVQKRTNSIITTMNKEITDNINTVEKEKTTSETNQKYQLLINELTTMNTYFKTIKETIIKMKTPCESLAGKPKCS